MSTKSFVLFFQKELERARVEQESAAAEKQNLEKRLKDEGMGLHTSYSDLEVSQLKAEIEVSKKLYYFMFIFDYYLIILRRRKSKFVLILLSLYCNHNNMLRF